MIKEKMKLDNDIGYVAWKSQYYKLYILIEFLSTEMIGGYDFFYNWMKNPIDDSRGGNLSFLEKCGDNILITLDFDEELYEKDPEKYSLTIPLEQLISVSEQWHEVIKNKPPFIIIIEDKGVYTVEASQE